jgi:hypothetical protein
VHCSSTYSWFVQTAQEATSGPLVAGCRSTPMPLLPFEWQFMIHICTMGSLHVTLGSPADSPSQCIAWITQRLVLQVRRREVRGRDGPAIKLGPALVFPPPPIRFSPTPLPLSLSPPFLVRKPQMDKGWRDGREASSFQHPSISMLWPFEAPALLRRARGLVLLPHSAQDAYTQDDCGCSQLLKYQYKL